MRDVEKESNLPMYWYLHFFFNPASPRRNEGPPPFFIKKNPRLSPREEEGLVFKEGPLPLL